MKEVEAIPVTTVKVQVPIIGTRVYIEIERKMRGEAGIRRQVKTGELVFNAIKEKFVTIPRRRKKGQRRRCQFTTKGYKLIEDMKKAANVQIENGVID